VQHVSLTRSKVTFAVERANAIRESGLPCSLMPCHRAVLACRNAAEIVREAASGAKPADLDDSAWRRLMTAVDEDARQLESAVRIAIDDARRPVRDLDPASFEALAVAFGKESRVRQLKLDRDQLLSGSWYEKSASELRGLLASRSSLLREANELGDTDAPESVKRFLDSARRAEATIAGLTPEVCGWLEKKGLLGQLRITLGVR
jgi:hypothetical protein